MTAIGITRDQEVFETPDPPSSSFNYEDDRQSQTVQSLSMDMKSSYNRFKDSSLDTRDADFSDRLGRPKQHGFRAEPSEYGIQPVTREPETLMERYQRLKQEVVELISDVSHIQDGQNSSEKMLEVSPVDLLQDVQLLQKQLHDVQMDKVLGTQHLTSPEHPPYHSLLLRELKTQIEALGSERGIVSDSHGDQPIYELYARTESTKFSHVTKLSEVEERLSHLENIVGNTDTQVSTVAAGLDADQKDLSTAVLNLQAKVALLDSGHINAVGMQLQEVLLLLEEVEKKTKEKTEADPNTQTKISQALEAVSGIRSIAPLVPDLISRLHALKDLHERASQFASSVAFMSDSQEQLSTQSKELQTQLSKMQTSFQENLTTIQSNFASLESRISSLKA